MNMRHEEYRILVDPEFEKDNEVTVVKLGPNPEAPILLPDNRGKDHDGRKVGPDKGRQLKELRSDIDMRTKHGTSNPGVRDGREQGTNYDLEVVAVYSDNVTSVSGLRRLTTAGDKGVPGFSIVREDNAGRDSLKDEEESPDEESRDCLGPGTETKIRHLEKPQAKINAPLETSRNAQSLQSLGVNSEQSSPAGEADRESKQQNRSTEQGRKTRHTMLVRERRNMGFPGLNMVLMVRQAARHVPDSFGRVAPEFHGADQTCSKPLPLGRDLEVGRIEAARNFH